MMFSVPIRNNVLTFEPFSFCTTKNGRNLESASGMYLNKGGKEEGM